MFGIGLPEMILILALALIVVGPDKLPDLARSIAKTIMDLKKTAEGLKDTLHIEDNPLNEIRPELEDAAKNFKETILDSETHTLKDPSQSPTPDTYPLEQSLPDPLLANKTGQQESEAPLTEPNGKETPKSSGNTQSSNSVDADKQA